MVLVFATNKYKKMRQIFVTDIEKKHEKNIYHRSLS